MTSKTLFLNSAIAAIICLVSFQKINAQKQSHPAMLKTKSGLTYQIIPGKGLTQPKAGEFIKFRLSYILEPKDSLLHSSFNSIPDYAPVDTGKKVQYSFMEIVPKMKAGDSAVINISVDSLVQRKIMPDYNEVFQKGSMIKCDMKLLNVFKSDSSVKVDYAKEMDVIKDEEIKELQKYMTQNNLQGIRTANGVYIVMENPGDTSLKAEPGKTASIMYKGYLLNGQVFDTNMDSSKGHTDPIAVPVGQHRVIPGWEEALPYFGKGGKGKLLIPAMLAYGAREMGADIPAYSNLVFDIEVVDVK